MNAESLIKDMNECLKRIILRSEVFLKETQERDYSGVSTFDESRAFEISQFQNLDQQLIKMSRDLPAQSENPIQIESLRSLIFENESLLQTLAFIDQKIHIHLELEKAAIQSELNRYERETEKLNKFKSTWVPESGERLDGTL